MPVGNGGSAERRVHCWRFNSFLKINYHHILTSVCKKGTKVTLFDFISFTKTFYETESQYIVTNNLQLSSVKYSCIYRPGQNSFGHQWNNCNVSFALLAGSKVTGMQVVSNTVKII